MKSVGAPTLRFMRLMRTLAALLFFALLSPLFPVPASAAGEAARITGYQVIRQPVRDAAHRLLLAIRSFNSDGVPQLLAVDPFTLRSLVAPASAFRPAPEAEAALAASPYLKALERYDSPPDPLQNDGATRAQHPVPGLFLTVDLCPSRRPFERELFQTLISAAGKGNPAPVALAVTGVWLERHPEELAYLKEESAAGRLAITWVNHSFHHPYDPSVPLARNFLLTPGADFSSEVLDLERTLLAHGLVPSPFFRFPGLVSDAATVKRLRELSLIQIGSDAWLAKGETPRQGSFILVHGNGNEPKGIKLLLPMLRGGNLHLLPLPQAFLD